MSTRKLTEIGVRSSVKLTGDIGKDNDAIRAYKAANPSTADRDAANSVFHTEMCRLMNTQDNGEGEG